MVMKIGNLVPWRRPGAPARRQDVFANLHREMDDVLHSFLRGREVDWPAEALVPDMDVSDSEKEIRVTAEVPGVEEKDLDVSVQDGVLRIRGEKKAEKEEKNGGRHYVERTYGCFERNFELPSEVDVDKIKADLKKGVLTVVLPKAAKPENTKKIAVQAK
jgi:HSP20 family protein